MYFHGINLVRAARGYYLKNNLDKMIQKSESIYHTVEIMTLFVNDQAYNYILELGEKIKKNPVYRQSVKKTFNDMEKAIKRYNSSIYSKDDSRNKVKSYMIAEITQLMEEDLSKHIYEISNVTRYALTKRGFKQDRVEIATLSIIVSCMATISDRLLSNGYKMLEEVSGTAFKGDFDFLSIKSVSYLSVKLSDYLTNGEINLSKDEADRISKAMDAFLYDMSNEETVDKIFDIFDKHKDELAEEDKQPSK